MQAEVHRQASIATERTENGGLTNHETALRQHFVSSHFLGSENMILISSLPEFTQNVLKARNNSQKIVVGLFRLDGVDTERHLAFLRQTADTCAHADSSSFSGCRVFVVMEPALAAVAAHLNIEQPMLEDGTNLTTDGIAIRNISVNPLDPSDVYAGALIYRAHVGFHGMVRRCVFTGCVQWTDSHEGKNSIYEQSSV